MYFFVRCARLRSISTTCWVCLLSGIEGAPALFLVYRDLTTTTEAPRDP